MRTSRYLLPSPHCPTRPRWASCCEEQSIGQARLGRWLGHRRWHAWLTGAQRLPCLPREKFLPPDPREPASTHAVMLWLVGHVASGPSINQKVPKPSAPHPTLLSVPKWGDRRGSGSCPDRHCQSPPPAMGTSSTSPRGATPWLLSPVSSVP